MTPADDRVLRQHAKRLMSPKTYLAELQDGGFGLFRDGQKSARPQAKIATRHILAWRKADLLEGDVHLALSAQGRARLRRQAAGGDFAAQHSLLQPEGADGAQRRQGSALDWLRARGQGRRFSLTEAEFRAGEMFAADYHRAAFAPRQTMDWQRPVYVDGGASGQVPDAPAHVLDARRKLQAALDHLGPGLAETALAVCCQDMGLEGIEQNFALPKRSAKLLLKLSLMRLSVFYGFQSEAAAAASLRIR